MCGLWYDIEICKESPQRQRESLYYLALGHYKMGGYVSARDCIDQLLAVEPRNQQARQLRDNIDGKVRRGKLRRCRSMDKRLVCGCVALANPFLTIEIDGILGFALASSLVAIAGVVAAKLLSRKK